MGYMTVERIGTRRTRKRTDLGSLTYEIDGNSDCTPTRMMLRFCRHIDGADIVTSVYVDLDEVARLVPSLNP